MRISTFTLLFLACTVGLSPALATHRADADDLATLVVRLRATGGDAAFAFTADGAGLPAAFAIATANGTGSAIFDGLDAADDPEIAAVPPEGWALAGASCDRGEPEDVELVKGETTTCTFDLAVVAGLTVVVHSAGGDGTFEFDVDDEADGSLPRAFRVTTNNGVGNASFDDVEPGNYSIVPDLDDDDWRLLAATCTSGTPTNLTFAAGVRVTCTFNVTSLALVRGVVWRDADRDGDRDANESGAVGRTVFADLDGDGALDANEPRVLTGADGKYALEGVATGRRTIAVLLGSQWNATDPDGGRRSIRLDDAEVEENVDFGVWGPLEREDPPTKIKHGKHGKRGGDDHEREGSRGWGYWKNAHKRADEAALDAFLADYAHLFPANYTADRDGLKDLLQDVTKQCNKKLGHLECLRLKLDARRLVVALWASGWRA